MWSNVISIDKQYEREIDFIIERLKGMRNLSFAIEESRDRIFIYVAAVCEMREEAEKEISEILKTVFLIFMKQRFFLESLPKMQLNHANCAMMCALVYFDSDYESGIVERVLNDCADYNVDGLMTFRLGALVENWQELTAVAARLGEGAGEDKDMYDIAAFITGTEGGGCRLKMYPDRLFNVTKERDVEVIPLFEDSDKALARECDLISAIIKEHAGELVVSGCELPAKLAGALRHIVKVIT